jgi:hypothetical protein
MNYYLYRHIRLDKNEVFYIGIGKKRGKNKCIYERAGSRSKRNSYWKRIVALTNYEVEIVMEFATWEEAVLKEVEMIAVYGRSDLGKGTLCNQTDGGEGAQGSFRTQETKDKLRAARIGRKLSPEHRASLCAARKGRYFGENNAMYGKSGDKAPMYGVKGKDHPMYGKKHTRETLIKIGEASKGNKHNCGRVLSEDNKRKMFEARMRNREKRMQNETL